MNSYHQNSQQLELLLQAVFGPQDERARGLKQGLQPACSYMAFPSTRNARVLLPRWDRLGAAGYLEAGIGLRQRRQATLRRAGGRFIRAGGLALSTSGTRVDLANAACSLQAAVSEHIERRVGSLAFSVREWSPNWKPTFAVMDTKGAVIGYGKVGWDRSSIDRIGVEAETLTALAENPISAVRSPDLLAHFDWNDRSVLVVSPVPETAVRFARSGTAPSGLVLAELQRSGAKSAEAGALLESALDGLGEPSGLSLVGDVQKSLKCDWDVELTLGLAHGDWVPWNVAIEGSTLWAFDWEHSAQTAPVGLDIGHWHTLSALRVPGQSPFGALVSGRRASVQQLRHLGFDHNRAELITTLALLRLVTLRREFLGPLTGHEGSVRRLVFAAIG